MIMTNFALNEILRLNIPSLKYCAYAYDFEDYADSITIKYRCDNIDRFLFITIRCCDKCIVRFLLPQTNVPIEPDDNFVSKTDEKIFRSIGLDKNSQIKIECNIDDLVDVVTTIYTMFDRQIPF